MSEWIEHDGKGMPVPETALVEVRSARGWTIRSEAVWLKWANVVAYRFITKPDSAPTPPE